MPSESNTKGRSLETAVRFIQEAILEADPRFRGTRCTIESNKIERVNGVRHEIDVLVKTHPDSVYSATWIFECKNWEKPVGKVEVIHLAEKVEALAASGGFLVAKEVTSDAAAQLQLKPRLKHLRCTEDFLSPLSSAELIYFDQEVLAPSVVVTWRGGKPANQPSISDATKLACVLNDRPIDFIAFIEKQIDEIADETRKENHLRLRNEGTHWVEGGRGIDFAPTEFTIEGVDVESIAIPLRSFVTSKRRKLVSRFELQGQGQVFAFEPIERDDGHQPIEIHIVTRFGQK